MATKTNGRLPKSKTTDQQSKDSGQEIAPVPQMPPAMQTQQQQMMQGTEQMIQMAMANLPQMIMQAVAQSFDLTQVSANFKEMFPADAAGSGSIKRTVEIIEEDCKWLSE